MPTAEGNFKEQFTHADIVYATMSFIKGWIQDNNELANKCMVGKEICFYDQILQRKRLTTDTFVFVISEEIRSF